MVKGPFCILLKAKNKLDEENVYHSLTIVVITVMLFVIHQGFEVDRVGNQETTGINNNRESSRTNNYREAQARLPFSSVTAST